jgi:beta-1,4-mannosyl-glycoprotein beta-1,4-N-acetylglucosaminyltransferase
MARKSSNVPLMARQGVKITALTTLALCVWFFLYFGPLESIDATRFLPSSILSPAESTKDQSPGPSVEHSPSPDPTPEHAQGSSTDPSLGGPVGIDSSPDRDAGKETAPPHDSQTARGFLSIPEAEAFCSHRRWPIYPARHRRRKIYDLMMVNDELDMLELRLAQLYADVDYFVIVESATSFTNSPKPLHVHANWRRFAAFHDKIIRHTVDYAVASAPPLASPWDREAFSRNAMYDQVVPALRGPRAIAPGDVLLVSDVDELPRPATLTALRNCAFPALLTLHTDLYYSSSQGRGRAASWPHPQATFYAGPVRTLRPQDVRFLSVPPANSSVPDPDDDLDLSHLPARVDIGDLFHAGWHCSYCFARLAELRNKLRTFSHSELNRAEFTSPRAILRRVRAGLDLFDRPDTLFDRVDRNLDVPDVVLRAGGGRAAELRYAYLLDRDPEGSNFADWEEVVSEVERGEGLTGGRE